MLLTGCLLCWGSHQTSAKASSALVLTGRWWHRWQQSIAATRSRWRCGSRDDLPTSLSVHSSDKPNSGSTCSSCSSNLASSSCSAQQYLTTDLFWAARHRPHCLAQKIHLRRWTTKPRGSALLRTDQRFGFQEARVGRSVQHSSRLCSESQDRDEQIVVTRQLQLGEACISALIYSGCSFELHAFSSCHSAEPNPSASCYDFRIAHKQIFRQNLKDRSHSRCMVPEVQNKHAVE